jgi:hypothetical protein
LFALGFGCGVALASCLVADAGARLEYVRGVGAEACPDEHDVRDAITARLGADPFSDQGGRTLSCRIEADRQGLRAEIAERRAGGVVAGVRSLATRDSSCRDLAPALLLVLSLAARAPESAPELEPPPPRAPSPPVVRAAAVPAAIVTTGPAPLAVQVGAGLFVTEASLPGLSAGGMASIGIARDGSALSLELAGEAPRSVALAVGQVTAWRASAALVPCRTFGLLIGCAVGAAGLLHGEGRGIPQARAATGPWLGLGARLGVRVPLGRAAALEAHADAVAPVLRTRLLVGEAAVWTTPPAAASIGLTLVRRFR